MIVLTHRGPASFTRRPDGSFEWRRGAGGVVSALTPILAADSSGSSWVAAAMTDDDRAAVHAGAATVPGIDLHLLDLDPRLHRLHYDVVSNATLWFLHHGLFDLPRRPRFDRYFDEAWDGYAAVNRAFADHVIGCASDGEVVLVQDIHLTLVPGYLREARPDLRVLHFTHTPFCGPNSIRVLPDRSARAMCESMARVPCGFHTRRWASAYQASARTVLGAEHPLQPAFAAPLGPDPTELQRTAESTEGVAAGRALDELVGDSKLVLRTDRIEPSKNIVRGFLAFDRLLEKHREWQRRVVFVAMLYHSRQALPEYQAYAQEVEQAALRLNDRWSAADWQPVVLETRDDPVRSVAGLVRYDVLVVNPIKDGLNLVAKEGPLVNRRDGTLCLSPEAGAYDELAPAAIAVHPFDLEQNADALHEALSMPVEDRRVRAARLRDLAGARTPSDWLADLVSAARRAR